MQIDESVLFVFMLAAFLGFELVRRVSPLLHTPLMSLTTRSRLSRGRRDPHRRRQGRQHAGAAYWGFGGGHRIDHQRGQRVSHHRPHVENVQKARYGEALMDLLIQTSYLAAAGLSSCH